MQRFVKLDAQDQPLPDDAPFEQVGGILVKAANIIVAPFELTKGKGATYAEAIKLAEGCAHQDKVHRALEVEELFLIPDRSKYRPAVDQNFFPFINGGWFWSATKDASDPSSDAWLVGFGSGDSDWGYQLNGGLVLACRSASQS